MLETLKSYLPILNQLEGYILDDFTSDAAAGFTVSVILIPQGMAYALIAGLDPIYGLYAALVPPFVYALFGTSRQLAVGPAALVSLLVAASVRPLADGDPAQYLALALVLTVLVRESLLPERQRGRRGRDGRRRVSGPRVALRRGSQSCRGRGKLRSPGRRVRTVTECVSERRVSSFKVWVYALQLGP